MRVEKDFEELLKLFNQAKVKYCIVGAFAVAFYAIARYTKDMDIYVEPSLENGEKIIKALKKFGFKFPNLRADDFEKEGNIIQLGFEPVRVDIINLLSGCTFESVWKTKQKGQYGRTKVFFIGLDELIVNKKSSPRSQDKKDIEILQKARKKIRKNI